MTIRRTISSCSARLPAGSDPFAWTRPTPAGRVSTKPISVSAGNGLQDSQLRRLKGGQIPFDGSIDLHGMTVEKARELLWDFIDEATRIEVRCIRVTHGKAQRKDGRRPILKSHVNTWLRQHPKVLAFT